jgi:hypothetical protein
MPSLTTRRLLEQHGSRILLGCRCGWQREVDLGSAPAELLDVPIAELHAWGRWACGKCARRPATMVYAWSSGMIHQVERYGPSGETE